MESETEQKKARDEVMRKIGRNVILFQQMELMLKNIISEWEFSGYTSELLENKTKKKTIVSKQTMGQLTEQFLNNTFSEYKAPEVEPTNKKEIFWDVKINIPCDTDYYEKKKQALSAIVSSRNNLIHHLLPEFDPNSLQSCLKTDQYLDEQREKILPEYDTLSKAILVAEQARINFLKYAESGKLKADLMLSQLRQSRLVALLAETSLNFARPDGWTQLSIAGQIAHKNEPDEIVFISKNYKVKSLKELILATGVFDLNEEPTDRGGIRVLYRLKAGWELTPE
jgi:hypothetical protein